MIKYDEDFYGWSQEQAEYLRAGVWKAVDAVHVAEEIEALGKSDRRAITRQLRRLLSHLLKWSYQPTHRTPSWRRSIRLARQAIADILEDNHSLRNYPRQRVPLTYRQAREAAADETGLPLDTFPPVCPWAIDLVLDQGFWPDAEVQ